MLIQKQLGLESIHLYKLTTEINLARSKMENDQLVDIWKNKTNKTRKVVVCLGFRELQTGMVLCPDP